MVRTTNRKIISILICIGTLYLPNCLKRWTHSFHLSRCHVEFFEKDDFHIFSGEAPEEIKQILSQDFFYLDRGAQAFVFISKDRNYVLKFFFFDSPQRERKAATLLQACKAACLYTRKETGILYAHLQLKKAELPTVRLLGPAWHRSKVDLNRMRFALQIRAIPLKEVLLDAYRRQDRGDFYYRINALLAALKKRIAHGIRNDDSYVMDHFGFVDDQPIEIDFANFRFFEEIDPWTGPGSRTKFYLQRGAGEEARYISKLSQWVAENMPEWSL